MKPIAHIAASLSISACIWYFTKSLTASVLSFAAGAMIDLDHIIDYAMNFGWKSLTLNNVYKASLLTNQKKEGGFKKIHLFFHADELVILFWTIYLFTNNLCLLAIALGYSAHIIMDYASNGLYPFSYLFICRAIKNFDRDKLLKRTAIIITVLMLAGNAFAISRDFLLTTSGRNIPQPRLISPITDTVDLTGQDKLVFRWSTIEGDTFRRSYYDFRLYKGYDMVESTLIFKKQVPPLEGELALDASMFEDGQVYTWSLRQKYSGGKSEKSYQPFKVIKK
jgi:hypothetical protein